MPEAVKTAVVFPGQGSQFVGMGRDLFDVHASVRELFGLASDKLGFDLARICFDGPEEELAQTRVTASAVLQETGKLLRR